MDKPKVGDFCRFWDFQEEFDSNFFAYGYLFKKGEDPEFPFTTRHDAEYAYAEKVTHIPGVKITNPDNKLKDAINSLKQAPSIQFTGVPLDDYREAYGALMRKNSAVVAMLEGLLGDE